MPVEDPTVATAASVLLQVPPVMVSVHVVVRPIHTVAAPVITDGIGVTVTVAVEKQPVGMVKLIIAVPPEIPVTTPVVGFTVATEVVLLLHVPGSGGGIVDKGVVAPAHIDSVPVIAGATGRGLTVTIATTLHVPATYVTMLVPTDIPVTIPEEEPIVTTDGVPLVHVPPGVELESVVVKPIQVFRPPDSILGQLIVTE